MIACSVNRPDAATASMGLFCSLAIKPMMLKMTKPANIDVPLLIPDMMIASLDSIGQANK